MCAAAMENASNLQGMNISKKHTCSCLYLVYVNDCCGNASGSFLEELLLELALEVLALVKTVLVVNEKKLWRFHARRLLQKSTVRYLSSPWVRKKIQCLHRSFAKGDHVLYLNIVVYACMTERFGKKPMFPPTETLSPIKMNISLRAASFCVNIKMVLGCCL